MSTPNLKYLTTEQVLQDVANFIEFFKRKHNLPHNKWVLFGCSYSGNLVAWFRLKYPHLVAGAIASSAPVQAKLEFNECFHVVAKSISPQCIASLRQQVGELYWASRRGKPGWAFINRALKLEPKLDGNDWRQLPFLLARLRIESFPEVPSVSVFEFVL